MTDARLDTARRAVALSIPVLATWGTRPDGSCRCRPAKPRAVCANAGKHPIAALCPRGVNSSTLDLDLVLEWLAEYGTMNIATRCGERMTDGRYLVGLDVDPHNDGDAALTELERAHGALPDTVRVITPTGSTHHLFGATMPLASSNPGRCGLDLQAAGRYLVGVGSTRRGGAYLWDAGAHPDDTPIADLPAWLTTGRRRPLGNARPGHGDAIDTFFGVAFAAMGWMGERKSGGTRMVRCPNAAAHSDGRGNGRDDSSVLFSPARGRPRDGRFHCSHSHCGGLTEMDLLTFLSDSARHVARKRYPHEFDLIVARSLA